MARQRQTQTVPASLTNSGDRVLVGGKFVLIQNVQITEAGVFFDLRGRQSIRMGLEDEVTIVHRDPRCYCGCGESTQGGLFVPGHDARVHAGREDLIRKVREGADLTDKERAKLTALVAEAKVLREQLPDVRGELDLDVECSPECWGARGDVCVCSCGGANHQRSWHILAAMGAFPGPGNSVEWRIGGPDPVAGRVKVGRWFYRAVKQPTGAVTWTKRNGHTEIADAKIAATFERWTWTD